ncbi:MAG TPA: SET domain-containing protein [Allosphingosinicella sp.]
MKLPHEGVYVRLGLSPVHGIGVFAIRPIPEGTDIFANDGVPLVWVSKAELERADLTPAERALYHDFGINRGESIGCPANFHNLTPGWYLNEPAPGAEANVESTDRLGFIARRDIAEGEELCIDYAGFSEQSEPA